MLEDYYTRRLLKTIQYLRYAYNTINTMYVYLKYFGLNQVAFTT